jgi:DNA repair protein RecO (recombination protein O)
VGAVVHRALSIASGGSVCPQCRPAGSVAPHLETLQLLAALLSGDWTVAGASDERRRREASGIVAAYLQWHLERQVRSLRLVDRTSTPARAVAPAPAAPATVVLPPTSGAPAPAP